MALKLTAKLDTFVSADLDCYTADLDNGQSIDFWFPKSQRPTSMDIHVEFEREDGEDDE